MAGYTESPGGMQRATSFMNTACTYAVPVADPWETWFVETQLHPIVASNYSGGAGIYLTMGSSQRIINHFKTLSRGDSVVTAAHFDDVIPSSREKKMKIWYIILSFVDFNGDGKVELGEFIAYFIIHALRMDVNVTVTNPTNLRQMIPLCMDAFQVNINRSIEEFEAYICHS